MNVNQIPFCTHTHTLTNSMAYPIIYLYPIHFWLGTYIDVVHPLPKSCWLLVLDFFFLLSSTSFWVLFMFVKVRKSSNRQHKFHGICKSGPEIIARAHTCTHTQLDDYHQLRAKVNESVCACDWVRERDHTLGLFSASSIHQMNSNEKWPNAKRKYNLMNYPDFFTDDGSFHERMSN